jgi:hypothetical protein
MRLEVVVGGTGRLPDAGKVRLAVGQPGNPGLGRGGGLAAAQRRQRGQADDQRQAGRRALQAGGPGRPESE